jgi:hypothetical protein
MKLSKSVSDANREILIGDYIFTHVCRFEPELDEGRTVRAFFPHLASTNPNLKLHQYGSGPFCKFSIPSKYSDAGVYVLTVASSVGKKGTIRYIGECRNLAKRYNAGYGNISPRNCFVGGQRTNCRINNFVYEVLAVGQFVDLWFLQTEDYKAVEAELISGLQPSWNRKGLR